MVVKKTEVIGFHPHVPGIKYLQYDENKCCFSSLVSALFDPGEYVSEQNISLCLKESLACEPNRFTNKIQFDNDIIIDKERNKIYQRHRYKLLKRKKKSEFDSLSDISDYDTLVQLIDTFGIVNKTASIYGY